MRETKQEIMAGVSYDTAKVVARNTVEYFQGDKRFIRLHHTDILEFEFSGIVINSGGWKTKTTLGFRLQ